MYVVNVLKGKTGEFKYPAARIQAHLKEIECYVETIDNGSKIIKKIHALPQVWVENILIVDDEQLITGLIRSLLDGVGDIDVALDGQEALRMMENRYYKLIISDVDMPVMDGISLYEKAAARFRDANSRFLFMTGDLSPERQAFFAANQLKYLEKPMQIKTLKEEAMQIMLTR